MHYYRIQWRPGNNWHWRETNDTRYAGLGIAKQVLIENYRHGFWKRPGRTSQYRIVSVLEAVEREEVFPNAD